MVQRRNYGDVVALLIALTVACGARAEVEEMPASRDDETRLLSPADTLNNSNALRSAEQNVSEGEASNTWSGPFSSGQMEVHASS